MKIAIVVDKSRADYLPKDEGRQEDGQSYRTMEMIKEALSDEYDVTHMTMDFDIVKRLKKEKVDLVFNLCNGIRGEGRLLQLPAILEGAGIPYTGSDPLGHGLAYNKIISGKLFKASGIPTPDFICIEKLAQVDEIELNYPVIVKPKDEGSSRGIHDDCLILDKKSLKEKIGRLLKYYNPPIMVMEYIDGREFTVALLEDGKDLMVFPILEIDLTGLPDGFNKIYSFEAKFQYADYVKYHLPARLEDGERKRIEEAAMKAFRTLGLRDYARVDIRLEGGIPYVIEVNSLPGLDREVSDICKMADYIGMEYDQLIKTIVKQAINRSKLLATA